MELQIKEEVDFQLGPQGSPQLLTALKDELPDDESAKQTATHSTANFKRETCPSDCAGDCFDCLEAIKGDEESTGNNCLSLAHSESDESESDESESDDPESDDPASDWNWNDASDSDDTIIDELGNVSDVDPASEPSTSCRECGKTFSTIHVLKIHSIVHTGERPYACEKCPKAFTQLGNLKIHQETHKRRRIRAFPCTVRRCGKAYYSKGELKMHLRSHAPEKKPKCATCKKTFATAFVLRAHQRRVHLHVKQFNCEIENCTKGFYSNWELTIHRRVHAGERPFKCAHCDKGYFIKAELKKHLRKVHDVVLSNKCTICGKKFTRSANARRHERKCHPRAK